MKSEVPFVPFSRSTGRRWSALLAVALFLTGTAMKGQAPVTVLRGATLIDGTGSPPLENAVIVVRGNRIDRIAQGGVAIPAGARVMDVSGYILPGLIDTHLHYKDWFPELMISNGVTSVLAYAGGPWINVQREAIEKGKILGPRMFLSQGTIGRIYMGATDIVPDTDSARRRVRELVEKGASIIKVYTSVTPEILRAVADEAHRLGLKVSGHIGIGARAAAEAGLDNLSHGTGLAIEMLRPEDREKIPQLRVIDTGRLRVAFPKIKSWDESSIWSSNPDLLEYPLFLEDPRRLMMFGMMDRDLARDLIQLLVREEVFIESAIGYTFRDVNEYTHRWEAEDHRMLSDPDLHYVPERMRMNILDYRIMDELRPDEVALMKQGYRNFQWFVRSFVEAGGKLDVGVDTSSVYHATMMPGVATRREMELLVAAGLSPMQAIQAATLWPAQMLHKTADLGTLEAGKLADLIVLGPNPLEDITAFKEVRMVMQDGRFLPVGYHYDFANPIPWPPGNELSFGDWGPVSEIPTRIESIDPPVVVEGDNSFTLQVRGHEFISSSVVELGGQWLATERIDSSRLRAAVPAHLVRRVGTFPVRVVHRAPGWGTTNTVYLIVKFR